MSGHDKITTQGWGYSLVQPRIPGVVTLSASVLHGAHSWDYLREGGGHTWTIGLVSVSGGNFDSLINEQFVGTLQCCNVLTINIFPKEILKISTTT